MFIFYQLGPYLLRFRMCLHQTFQLIGLKEWTFRSQFLFSSTLLASSYKRTNKCSRKKFPGQSHYHINESGKTGKRGRRKRSLSRFPRQIGRSLKKQRRTNKEEKLKKVAKKFILPEVKIQLPGNCLDFQPVFAVFPGIQNLNAYKTSR